MSSPALSDVATNWLPITSSGQSLVSGHQQQLSPAPDTSAEALLAFPILPILAFFSFFSGLSAVFFGPFMFYAFLKILKCPLHWTENRNAPDDWILALPLGTPILVVVLIYSHYSRVHIVHTVHIVHIILHYPGLISSIVIQLSCGATSEG